jgi:hypothetical protein
MPTFTGTYAYSAPGAVAAVQEGSGQVSFDRQTLTLSGRGAPLAFDLGDIDVFEPGEYELRLLLYSGHSLRLGRFGKSFQDLVRQLLEAFRDRLVECLLVSDLDEVARYAGRVHLQSGRRSCEGPAEIRLYESNLAVLPDADRGFQWRLAEIDEVVLDEREYSVVVRRGDERLAIGRLAKRTGELADRLRQRIAALNERSARVLHAVFPFLSAEQFRQAAGRMREGASTSILELRPVHRLIETALLEKVVDGPLRPFVRALVARASADGWQAGFKIVRTDTEADAANGGAPGEDPEGKTAGADADEAQATGEGWPEPAPPLVDLGEGLDVLFWFFVPVATSSATAASHLAWEATSRGGRATYVFRLPPGQAARTAVAGINDGLVALNFRREPIYLAADALESDLRYRHYAIATRKVPELALVRGAFVGRAIHRSLPSWRKQLDVLLPR